METIKLLLLTTALILAPLRALADPAFVLKTGVDMTHYQSTSIYSVGWQDNLTDALLYQVDVGAWLDSMEGHRSSPFASVLIGPRLGDLRGFNTSAMVGITTIGFVDAALSTPLEFTEEIALGYKSVAVGYKHISNAGIKEPNHGRDYLFVNWTLLLF